MSKPWGYEAFSDTNGVVVNSDGESICLFQDFTTAQDRALILSAPVLAADLAASQAEVARLREALVSAEHDLTYAIYNLTDGKKVEDLSPRIVDSTCPTQSGLIGLRTIQDALSK